MNDTPHISTYWHDAYISAARVAFPAITTGQDLAVGWKLTRKDGTTHGGYYWPLVNGDHDLPVLHEAEAWDPTHGGSCPSREGDGLCLVTTHAGPASSGGVSLSVGVGHVLVFASNLAQSTEPGKYRVPWCVDVDTFDPIEMIRANLLPAADLYGANLYRADLYGANLYRANLSWADLSGANLYRADLYGADLYRANLYGANLYGANLTGANLSWADLYRANLTGANLYKANLTGANLSGANLTKTSASTDTIFPAGFHAVAAGVMFR